jgi:O-methyltransferase
MTNATTSPPVGPERQLITEAYQVLRATKPWGHVNTPNILHSRVLPYATYSPWLSDAAFLEIYELIRSHTLVDIYRCYELWCLAQQARTVTGDILEVGVWRGGTGVLLSKAVTNSGKRVYLADTFTGVVKAGKNDTSYKGGEHADTSRHIVEDLILKTDVPNAELLVGIFPDDTGASVKNSLALMHVDVDVYESAKAVFRWAKSRLSDGAVVIVDDYGFHGCEGVTQLVNELRVSNEFLCFHNLNGHALLLKRH